MSELNLDNPVAVGVDASRRNTISLSVEKKCDGCGVKVYMSRPALQHSRRHAKRIGKPLYVVCWKCADPWIELAAQRNGGAEGTGAAMDDLMPEIRRRQKRQLESN